LPFLCRLEASACAASCRTSVTSPEHSRSHRDSLCCGSDARAGHRRQHRHLLGHQLGPAAPASLPRARPPCASLRDRGGAGQLPFAGPTTWTGRRRTRRWRPHPCSPGSAAATSAAAASPNRPSPLTPSRTSSTCSASGLCSDGPSRAARVRQAATGGDPELWILAAALRGDRAAVNRQIELNSEKYTVVGIMPSWFNYPRARRSGRRSTCPRRAWVRGGSHSYLAIGRLKRASAWTRHGPIWR